MIWFHACWAEPATTKCACDWFVCFAACFSSFHVSAVLVFFLLVFDTQIPGPLRFLQTGPKAVCYAWARAADASRVVSCTRCRELRASEISKTQWTTDDNSKSERNDRRLHRVPGHAGYKMVVSVWFRCGFCLMLWVFWWFLSTRLYHYQTLPD